MKISVVIPSYNSERTINLCLNSLLLQSYSFAYEVIVVDSSEDCTPHIIKKHFPQVRLIHFGQKTDPGTARNIGIKYARGELILFVDSDCIAYPDWIERMVNLHTQYPDIGAVGGSIEIGNNPVKPVAVAGYISEFREFLPIWQASFVKHLPTMNISYKKSVLEKVGQFDSQFYPQEDLVFNYRMTDLGYQILFDPTIRVKHIHREDLKSFLFHQKQIGKITGIVLKKIQRPGHFLVTHRWLFLFGGLFLPIVKFFRTLFIFIIKYPEVLFKYPSAIIIFQAGLIPWVVGLYEGVLKHK